MSRKKNKSGERCHCGSAEHAVCDKPLPSQAEFDRREMDRLELEITSLRSTIKNQEGLIDSLEKRAELWQEYAHGLESRVKIAEMDAKKRQAKDLSPLLMGAAAGFFGSYLSGLADKKDQKS